MGIMGFYFVFEPPGRVFMPCKALPPGALPPYKAFMSTLSSVWRFVWRGGGIFRAFHGRN
jgi:hypothetical protein